MGNAFGQHYVTVNVGSQNHQMKLWVTTQTPIMAVATT